MTNAARSIALAAVMTAAAGPSFADEPFLSPLPGEELPPPEAVAVVTYADGVRVTIDFAKLLVLERAASTVIVGNPAIAEATLSDDSTVILTGKTPGSTNFIALDENGEEIANLLLEVVMAGGHLITVHQGVGRETYTCARRCEPVLSVGDGSEFFSTTASQVDTRLSFSGGAE